MFAYDGLKAFRAVKLMQHIAANLNLKVGPPFSYTLNTMGNERDGQGRNLGTTLWGRYDTIMPDK